MIAQIDNGTRELFDQLFAGASSLATAPLFALAAGVLLMVLADLFEGLSPIRPAIFLGSIAAAVWCELRILLAETPPGQVLLGTWTADGTTALWGLVFLAGTALAWGYSHGYYSKADSPFRAEHDALMLAAPVGMMLMVGAEDLIGFFVGLELLSLPLYVLAAFRRARLDSVEAGVKYFLLGAFASGVFLYGSALLYAETGTLSLAGLAEADLGSDLTLVGAGLLAASLFFKVSVFPFHLWVPDVYQGAPTPVTALMSTGTKAAAFGFLLKVAFVLPSEGAGIVAAIAVLTMALGNLGALAQDDVKRMLAYSGVSHAGTLLLVVAGCLANPELRDSATDAALFYMAAYVVTATGAFGTLALLEGSGERFTKLANLRGLSASRPGVAAAFALFLLSLGGIPATGGFLGKWLVFDVLVRADMIVWAVLGVLMSVLALGYYLRVVVAIFMQPAPEGEEPPRVSRPLSAGIATVVCAAGVLFLGVAPGWLFSQL